MSLFKYGKFEKELDFTDVDFQEKLENAYDAFEDATKHLPATGKLSYIYAAQVECYDAFLENVLGESAVKLMFGEKRSLESRVNAMEQLANLRIASDQNLEERFSKFMVQKPAVSGPVQYPVNREQRRYNNKQSKKRRNYNQNYSG